MKDSCLTIVEVRIDEKKKRNAVMSTRIPTLLGKIDSLPNRENTAVILDFYKHMQDKGSFNPQGLTS